METQMKQARDISSDFESRVSSRSVPVTYRYIQNVAAQEKRTPSLCQYPPISSQQSLNLRPPPRRLPTSIRFLAHTVQTSVMHHRVIRTHGNDAAPEALVTNAADSFIRDDDAAVATPIMARHAVAEEERGLGVHDLALAQAGYDARFVDDGVCGADPAAEVRFQLGDGER